MALSAYQYLQNKVAEMESAPAPAADASNPSDVTSLTPLTTGADQGQTESFEPSAEQQSDPAIPATDPNSTDAGTPRYNELQAAFTRSRQELKESRERGQQTEAHMQALTNQVAQLQAIIMNQIAPQHQPQPEDLTDTLSDQQKFDDYLRRKVTDTLQKDLRYDPVQQEKVRLLLEVQEFEAEHPDAVALRPALALAYQQFPSLPRNRAGFEQAYGYIKSLIGLGGQAQAEAKAKGEAGNAGNGKQPDISNGKRPLTPQQIADANARAAALKNQTGVAPGSISPKAVTKTWRERVQATIEKHGGLV